ncbi:MAG: hypothetical protein ACREOU_01020 [Candidatus Eiseniibacteriota bacterium]
MLSYGERIRVTKSEPASARVTGTLLELSESAMTIEEEKGAEVLTVPLDSVRAVERSLGPQPNTGRGMLYGFLAGAAVGVGVALASDEDHSVGWITSIGLAGGLVGTGAGAWIGSRSHTERWQTVPPGSVRFGIAPVGSGIGLVVSFDLPEN